MSDELTPQQIAEVWMATSHITHATERQLAFARGVIEADRALGNKAAPGADHSGDLSLLVKRLVGALRRAEPGHQLANHAMDYLLRKGLAGPPLRVISSNDKN